MRESVVVNFAATVLDGKIYQVAYYNLKESYAANKEKFKSNT
ncbi:MAG: hypothetical protein ACOYBL_06490 [Lachnospiraceae bacterium]